MAYKDYYAILGVDRQADSAAIQKAYRALARKYHPDVSKEAKAEDRFKEIGEAYDVLKDDKTRKLYDQYGESWKAVSEGRADPRAAQGVPFDFSQVSGFDADAFGGDLGSIFEAMFGGQPGRGRGARAPRRPAAQEVELKLGVQEAYAGTERELALALPSGERRTVKVRIPARVRTGQKVRVAGQGPGGGDVLLKVQVTADSAFAFDGPDLVARLELTPAQAVLGETVELKTLDGSVDLRVPAGSSSGRRIRLKDRGYPLSATTRGHLFAEIHIRAPKELSDAERALYENLRALEKAESPPQEA